MPRGRPKGSKNTPTLFPTQRYKASFLSIPGNILTQINNIAGETKFGKQQVLEDILENGLYTVRKMYRGVVESRKAIKQALEVEKEEHASTHRRGPGPKAETNAGDQQNGSFAESGDRTLAGGDEFSGMERAGEPTNVTSIESGHGETPEPDPTEVAPTELEEGSLSE